MVSRDRTLRLAALIKVDDSDDDAEQILQDIIQTVRDRLEYWGVALETTSPYALVGEVTPKESK